MPGMVAGAATMGSNAKATTKGAIMLLTNFVFITVIPSVVLAFFDFSSLRTHFWLFTGVQNGNQREVTSKCGNFFKPKETKGRKTLLVPYEGKTVCAGHRAKDASRQVVPARLELFL